MKTNPSLGRIYLSITYRNPNEEEERQAYRCTVAITDPLVIQKDGTVLGDRLFHDVLIVFQDYLTSRLLGIPISPGGESTSW